MKKFELTHARHDPVHCLAPGLFRSLKRGERKRQKLDITYTYGNSMDSVRFWGPEPLGADDMRVLQGLVAMAAVSGEEGRGIMLRPDTESKAGQQMRLSLDLKFAAIEEDAMVAKGTYRSLAREIGYTDGGGNQIKAIRDSIERLWAVSVILGRGGRRQGFRILSEYTSNEADGRLYVALNPRLAEAIMGESPHTRISMDEVRALRSDPASLIHQRLCGWIDPGKTGRVTLDTLCSYVWPDECTANALKRRKGIARGALEEIAAIGWLVREYAKGKLEIVRPAAASQHYPIRVATVPNPRRNSTQSAS